MTTTKEAETRPLRPRLDDVGWFVDRRVTALQRDFLADRPEAVATLARLRRGIGAEPGAIAELWKPTLEGAPVPDNVADPLTYGEIAAYHTITLYALHQQSKSEPMHEHGRTLGAAVRRLRLTDEVSEQAVRRRFEALGTATDLSEAIHHARGLITQLRGAGIKLDYGSLADDLHRLQRRGGADRVRLAWGRDFYRTERKPEQGEPETLAGTE